MVCQLKTHIAFEEETICEELLLRESTHNSDISKQNFENKACDLCHMRYRSKQQQNEKEMQNSEKKKTKF